VIGTESLTLLVISAAAIAAEGIVLACLQLPLVPLQVLTSGIGLFVNLGAGYYYLRDRRHGKGWHADSATLYTEGWQIVSAASTPAPPGPPDAARSAKSEALPETELDRPKEAAAGASENSPSRAPRTAQPRGDRP
jgi:hypothetical protein